MLGLVLIVALLGLTGNVELKSLDRSVKFVYNVLARLVGLNVSVGTTRVGILNSSSFFVACWLVVRGDQPAVRVQPVKTNLDSQAG